MATFAGDTAGFENEDSANPIVVSGTAQVIDADVGEDAFNPSSQQGFVGDFVIDASGNWSYTVDNDEAVIQALTSTDQHIESFDVSSIDGSILTINAVVNGVDEAALTNSSTFNFDTGQHRRVAASSIPVGNNTSVPTECWLVIGAFSTRKAAEALSRQGIWDASGNEVASAFFKIPAGQSLPRKYVGGGRFGHIGRVDAVFIGPSKTLNLGLSIENIGQTITDTPSYLDCLRTMVTIKYPMLTANGWTFKRTFDASMS